MQNIHDEPNLNTERKTRCSLCLWDLRAHPPSARPGPSAPETGSLPGGTPCTSDAQFPKCLPPSRWASPEPASQASWTTTRPAGSPRIFSTPAWPALDKTMKAFSHSPTPGFPPQSTVGLHLAPALLIDGSGHTDSTDEGFRLTALRRPWLHTRIDPVYNLPDIFPKTLL